MHEIEKQILYKLITRPSLRYARLKPAEVEGNHFMYYVRKLTQAGLIEKNKGGEYQLTAKGKIYADQLSLASFAPRVQPRMVTLLAVQNDIGQWLMYRRHRQPLINQVGFPYGKIHLGESVLSAAERELSEKTGLAAELVHRGDGYITIYEADEPVSEVFFHLFSGKNPSGKIKNTPDNPQVFWARLDDIETDKLIPSMRDMVELLRTKQDHFFVELDYHN